MQTISYMAERVVGQGSFGVVFQVASRFQTPPLIWLIIFSEQSTNFFTWITCVPYVGKVFGDGWSSGHKEGASRQEVQEPRAANHAATRPPERDRSETLLLLDNREGRALPQLGTRVHARDGSPSCEALQQDGAAYAAVIREALYVSGTWLFVLCTCMCL